MLGENAVHADGVWKLQNDSTKEMTAQVRDFTSLATTVEFVILLVFTPSAATLFT